MQILLSCALAVCQGGYLGHLGYSSHWAYPQHIPVIGPNGVPVETPEVQHAKAAHFAAHAEAAARSGYGHGHEYGVVAPVVYHSHAYEIPKIGPNGVPLDTAEVAHAKAAHFAAHAEAAARNSLHGHGGWHYRRRRGIYAAPWAYPQHIPVIGPHGVPIDTPEVQHARAAHLAAHASAGSHVSHVSAIAPWSYAAHAPAVITHNGLPLDTPEVAHAKAAHVAAYNAAAVRNSVGPSGHVAVQQLTGGHHSLGHVLPLVSHGVPHDTPEVEAAKAAHFAAHAAASAHHY